jgi:transcriptional activator Myb
MSTSKEEDHVDYTVKDKQSWSIEEDLLICIFVDKFNVKKWNIIADELRKRVDGSQRIGK